MNSEKLFDICLDGWRQYDDNYGSDFCGKIKSYDFQAGIPLYTIELHLLKELNLSNISLLERSFTKQKTYFNELEVNRRKVLRFLDTHNKKYVIKGTTTFNVWTNVVEAKDFSNLKVISGRIDSEVWDDYRKLSLDIFNMDDDSLLKLNRRLLCSVNSPHEVIVIKDGNTLVGTGCYVVANQTCWFFGGAIKKDYQNNGIWKFLIQERQIRSQDFGAKYWFLQTSSDKIKGKSDYSFGLDAWLIEGL